MIVQALGAMADHVCYLWFCLGQPYEENEVLDALTTVWARSLGIEDSAAWRLPGRAAPAHGVARRHRPRHTPPGTHPAVVAQTEWCRHRLPAVCEPPTICADPPRSVRAP